MFHPDKELTDHAQQLCQQLLRIDTVNPPGNELPAAELVADTLADSGLDPRLLVSAPERANVVARLKGSGDAPPLLLTAHLDVVEADASQWRYPPLSGEIAEGFLWGRGAIDMKNMAAMCVALLARLAREGWRPERDIIFAAVADEETGCQHGSKWLCEEHPDLVRAEYAIGEGGGFNIFIGPQQLFTIQVAEKGCCWVRARVRGEPGHGSMPRPDSAILKLSAGLARLGRRGLPHHQTEVLRELLEAATSRQPRVARAAVSAALTSGVLPHLLKLIPDPSVARGMAAMFANTATPTVVRAGDKTNVIPSIAEVEIDGRTLPGQSNERFLQELQTALGPDFELEIMSSTPPLHTRPTRSPLYDTFTQVLAEREPDATPVPYLMPGFTDGKYFSRLGARWYGFAPVKLPRGLRFADLFHGHDERIPLDGLKWGTEVLAEVVTRFAGGSGVE